VHSDSPIMFFDIASVSAITQYLNHSYQISLADLIVHVLTSHPSSREAAEILSHGPELVPLLVNSSKATYELHKSWIMARAANYARADIEALVAGALNNKDPTNAANAKIDVIEHWNINETFGEVMYHAAPDLWNFVQELVRGRVAIDANTENKEQKRRQRTAVLASQLDSGSKLAVAGAYIPAIQAASHGAERNRTTIVVVRFCH
jgi:hypothetical protein